MSGSASEETSGWMRRPTRAPAKSTARGTRYGCEFCAACAADASRSVPPCALSAAASAATCAEHLRRATDVMMVCTDCAHAIGVSIVASPRLESGDSRDDEEDAAAENFLRDNEEETLTRLLR